MKDVMCILNFEFFSLLNHLTYNIFIFVLQLFKSNVHPHIIDIQQLNQELAALKDMSHVAAETLQRPVDKINARWSEIIQAISEREVLLSIFFCKFYFEHREKNQNFHGGIFTG